MDWEDIRFTRVFVSDSGDAISLDTSYYDRWYPFATYQYSSFGSRSQQSNCRTYTTHDSIWRRIANAYSSAY
jgi:hypothetical protein